MKIFLKFTGIALVILMIFAYLAFLFVLPNCVDLNSYKADIQKIINDEIGLKLNFENPKVIVTPLLGVGIKADNINLNLPDDSTLFYAKAFKGRIALPSLLLMTVKVSCLEVDYPLINLDIINGKEYNITGVVEDFIAKQSKKVGSQEQTDNGFTFDPSILRIKIPKIVISNYQFISNDTKAKHNLKLYGDRLVLGYFNGKRIKLKTDAKLLVDGIKNIDANIEADTFLPQSVKLEKEDDPAQIVAFPFINFVNVYRDYNLKADINAKLKIKQKRNNKLSIIGFLNADKVSLTLHGLQLPDSYFSFKAKGTSVDLDTNIFIADKQNISLKGNINYGVFPSLDLTVLSEKIYLKDVISLIKSTLNTLKIKNNLAEIKSKGYIVAGASIKTNFKKLISKGNILVRDLNIQRYNAVLADINADFLLDDNMLRIVNANTNINGSNVKAEGKIDENSNADIKINLKDVALKELFDSFATKDLKRAYDMRSGKFSLNINTTGELKNAKTALDFVLSDLLIKDKTNNIFVNNKLLKLALFLDSKGLTGNLANEGFKIFMPYLESVILNDRLNIAINKNDILLTPFGIKINNESEIQISGYIKNYTKALLMDIKAQGDLKATDIKRFFGPDMAILIDAKGKMPIKCSLFGNKHTQNLICQIMSDRLNYLTPLNAYSLLGKQTIIQAKVRLKKGIMTLKETGIFAKDIPTPFGDDYKANMEDTKKIFTITGTIVGLDSSSPFINLITVDIHEDIKASLFAFEDSYLEAGGKTFIFGELALPRIRGFFDINNLSIPSLYVTLKNAEVLFQSKIHNFTLDELELNNNIIDVTGAFNLEKLPVFNILSLNLKSKSIDVDSLMKIANASLKYFPAKPKNSKPADIPVIIESGNIDIKRLESGNILAVNTTGKISLRDNVFYLTDLYTHTFSGTVRGDISYNLLNSLITARVNGQNVNAEKAFLDLANLKDAVSGKLSFKTNISVSGETLEQQIKNLKGTISFVFDNGQFGPFGKLENMIMAENIRESEFFKTTVGSVINSITTIDTTHFNKLQGDLDFSNGTAKIRRITSSGDVLTLYIFGDTDLLKNTADIKVRARLASQISDMLGPVADINPVNLIKDTPGLNVGAAKVFQIFCEQVTQEEIDEIPSFAKDYSDSNATKFQIVLSGDLNKPFALVKSFKWLALASDIEDANAFVATLPSDEELEKAKNEAERKKKIKEFFNPFDNLKK